MKDVYHCYICKSVVLEKTFSFEFMDATLQECNICNVVVTLFPNIVDCGQVS